MSNPLPADVRQLVAERAGYRCEYCLIPDSLSFAPLEVEHIIAVKHGGPSTLDNLAYACPICNRRKGSDIASYIPSTGAIVPLYHPRRHRWHDHFRLDGALIRPITDEGQATITLLQLNRPTRLVERELLLQLGELVAPD